MVNSPLVGCGQRVVWVAAHAARAVLGLSDFLWVVFSGGWRLRFGGFHPRETGSENL
jgi:hypothetical protein